MKLPSIDSVALILLIAGGLNSGISTVFDYNVVSQILGHGSLMDAFSVAVGLSAAYCVADAMGVLKHGDA